MLGLIKYQVTKIIIAAKLGITFNTIIMNNVVYSCG